MILILLSSLFFTCRQLTNESEGSNSRFYGATVITPDFRDKIFHDLWIPTDFNESPAILNRIEDGNVKFFIKKLISYWPKLGRKIKDHVSQFPKQHSLTWLPNGFIIPGGRLQELHFWDSYYIIKGLLICDMKETVKGILDNFVYLIKTNNRIYIPRGTRRYWKYISSQPIFPAMVSLYIEKTNDIEWLKSNIDKIEDNFNYWKDAEKNIVVVIKNWQYNIPRFGSKINVPRAEDFIQDMSACFNHKNENLTRRCYSAMRAASESGWDFSTRWLYDWRGQVNTSLSFIATKRSLPVDLNALLCQGARLLVDFYEKIGNAVKVEKYKSELHQKIKNMENIFYNDADGIWYDYDTQLHQHRRFFFPSNFAPLWAECVDSNKMENYGKRAVEYLYAHGIDTYEGGIPTSLNENSNLKWDYPNAMPPLQELVVTALQKSGNLQARELARKFATRYIVSSAKAWVSTDGKLYDMFSAVEPGMPGKGGNIPVQMGYGWSIGVALSFIDQYACTTTATTAGTVKLILNRLFFTTVVSLIPLLENCYLTK